MQQRLPNLRMGCKGLYGVTPGRLRMTRGKRLGV
jgi:hypothetical protein